MTLEYLKQQDENKNIKIIHVLNDGTKITDTREFEEKYRDLFSIDKDKVIQKIRELRKTTKDWNKTILYIDQQGNFSIEENVLDS